MNINIHTTIFVPSIGTYPEPKKAFLNPRILNQRFTSFV
ncbi:hypothetical protein BD01_0441 [Thermococcus nautili]|uniref:Uncharacterized protein n=1 Tax=Thermococcus nautili TaxID=195522 RepID=W8P012_9EURY|nr:hypothetical protein BD01_0441 [Thermococcus nautili]